MGKMGDRLRAAMKARNRSVKDIAAAKVMSRANVYLILNGTTRADAIRNETAEKLARYLQVNQVWLTSGRGQMDIPEPRQPSQLAILDPEILHDALTLMLLDEKHGGKYTSKAYSQRLAELYGRLVADGGRLTSEHNAQFLDEIAARAGENNGNSAGKRRGGARG